MPKSVERARKQIARKRHGAIDSLHAKSRDSRRLHKAQIRDDRLQKLATTRNKRVQPLVDRVAFFKKSVDQNGKKPLSLDAVQCRIHDFIHQYYEEYDAIKKARRPGRPPSARDDLLKTKIKALDTEYQDGFFIPDLTTEKNIELLDRWEGSWPYLSNLAWVKVSSTGVVRPSSFQQKG